MQKKFVFRKGSLVSLFFSSSLSFSIDMCLLVSMPYPRNGDVVAPSFSWSSRTSPSHFQIYPFLFWPGFPRQFINVCALSILSCFEASLIDVLHSASSFNVFTTFPVHQYFPAVPRCTFIYSISNILFCCRQRLSFCILIHYRSYCSPIDSGFDLDS